ncbi:MAG: polysaccharide deacetylase family protein [Bacilli bacterium]|nr:polysaccharide deacetylase family protein [Bacilli bacterium]
MAKHKRKNNFGFILIIILLISSIGVMTFFIFSNKKSLENEQKLNKKLINKLNIKTNDYNEIINSNNELNKKIDELNNTVHKTEVTKQEVFKLASELEQKILSGQTTYKIAYLTFDDGPYYLTDKYLEVLRNYNVKATFFTIGSGKSKCYDNPNASCMETYKKIVDDGHTIANHTYSHGIFYGLYSSTNSFMTQVKKQEELIKEHTGVTTNIVRFPGGSSTAGRLKSSIIQELRNNGYGWVDWSAQDGDGGDLKSTTQAWNYFVNSINQDIEVVLFHDYNNITLSILPQAIEYLQNNNYILLPLFYESVTINK